jgi:hypothetical protein
MTYTQIMGLLWRKAERQEGKEEKRGCRVRR